MAEFGRLLIPITSLARTTCAFATLGVLGACAASPPRSGDDVHRATLMGSAPSPTIRKPALTSPRQSAPRVVQLFEPGLLLLDDGTIADGRARKILPGPEGLVLAAPGGLVVERNQKRYSWGPNGYSEELPVRHPPVTLGTPNDYACIFTPMDGVWCPTVADNCNGAPNIEAFGPPGSEVFPFRGLWCKIDVQVSNAIAFSGEHTIGCIVERVSRATYCWHADAAVSRVQLEDVREVAASSSHVCVLNERGQVGCWGDGSFGQLGYIPPRAVDIDEEFENQTGHQRRVSTTPPTTFLPLRGRAEHIYAADRMSCALLQDGNVWCWGEIGKLRLVNSPSGQQTGELVWATSSNGGNAEYKPLGASTLPESPIRMPIECAPTQVYVFNQQICVVCDSGRAHCWGDNRWGLLGYGDEKERWEPGEPYPISHWPR